jgi:plastocyanin
MYRRSRVTAVLIVLFALVALPACGSDDGAGSGSGENRTVLVDYNHDEFASAFLSYFPKSVSVHPGDTITFKQAWTGEPHSVTLGTLTDGLMREILPLLEKYPEVESAEALKAVDPAAFETYNRVCLDSGKIEASPESYCPAIPDMATFGGENATIEMNQNGAQPCYLDRGAPPTDKNTPCPKREQPEFNGRQAFYNSGYIHYEGDKGNTFQMTLSEDIKPGNYQYFCNFHSPFAMAGAIEVKPKSESVPSQSAVDRQARAEIQKQAAPLLKAFKEAEAGKVVIDGEPYKGTLAGYGAPDENELPAFISEFIPNPLKAKVGEKVSWYVQGHTVSFDVPRYFPIATVAKNGKVTLNPQAVNPIDSPVAEFPEPPDGPPGSGPPEPPPEVDAGKWNGRGFISSGLPQDDIIWSLTFTRPGKYKYACLIHPRMVGEVNVSS